MAKPDGWKRVRWWPYRKEPRMDANKRQLVLKDEVYQTICAAMEVSNHLGCGFLEVVYKEAPGLEFSER